MLFYIFVLGGGGRGVRGWDGRGGEVCIYSLEWEVLGQGCVFVDFEAF